MSGSSCGGPAPPQPRFTVVFQHTDEDLHCSGVEAIVASGSGRLFTASRDSTVRRWDVSGSSRPRCAARFEGHVDWVNGIALLSHSGGGGGGSNGGGSLLASCSSDRTVKLWRADASGPRASECVHTFSGLHSDYVTRVAAARDVPLLASAGLKSEVFLYDLGSMRATPLKPPPGDENRGGGGGGGRGPAAGAAAAREAGGGGGGGAHGGPGGSSGSGNYGLAGAFHQQQQQQQPAPPPAPPASKGSIYALAVSATGALLAAGTTEGVVRLHDPRTRQKVAKLKGHTDNVRSLLIGDDGAQLLSASSDGTVRVWDLRQQRCTQALALHTDSVWCLAASADLSTVWSGGRDGRVFRAHLARRETQLVAQLDRPVRAVALCREADGGGRGGRGDAGGGRLWVSTDAASVFAYDAPLWPSEQQQQQQQQQQQHHSQQQQQQQQQECGGTPRSAALSRAFLGGGASLRLRASADLGALRPEEPALRAPASTIPGAPALTALRVLPDKRHVLTRDSTGAVALWDVLLGAPVERWAPGGPGIEARERELWRPVAAQAWFAADVRLGRLALHLDPPGCFGAEAYAIELGVQGAQDDAKLNLGACLLRNALRVWALRHAARHMSGAPVPGLDDGAWPGLPQFDASRPPSVVTQDSRGATWRRPFDAFSGDEAPGDVVPEWAAGAVLHGTFPYARELKSAFVLHPSEGSGLPSLLQPRLNAPRVLQVKKVAAYCAARLAEAPGGPGALALVDVTWDPDSRVPPELRPGGGGGANGSQGGAEQQQPQLQQQYLELTCNGMAVPCDMSVAAVKKFLWRNKGGEADVVFHYRVLDPANPAPMPTIEPPPES